MPDIYTVITLLPRKSQMALAAEIIKRQRPTLTELADAAGADYNSIRSWLGIRPVEPSRAKKVIGAADTQRPATVK